MKTVIAFLSSGELLQDTYRSCLSLGEKKKTTTSKHGKLL